MEARLKYQDPKVSHHLCTIDPGKRACGVAMWSVDKGQSTLEWAGLVSQRDANPIKLARKILDIKNKIGGVFVFYVEDPQLYAHKRTTHRDLGSLKKVISALQSEGARPMHKAKPVQWKGNVPKTIHHDRMKKHLRPIELKLVPKDHNVLDAVALGLFALGRTGKGAVFSGLRIPKPEFSDD